jgi:hypothetical protein
MEWEEIKTQADANALMEVFGNFHDSCIREAHLWTDHWVSPKLSMSCCGHLDNKIRFLIQRQYKNPSAIELFFEHVTRFNLVPRKATGGPRNQVEMNSRGCPPGNFAGARWTGLVRSSATGSDKRGQAQIMGSLANGRSASCPVNASFLR